MIQAQPLIACSRLEGRHTVDWLRPRKPALQCNTRFASIVVRTHSLALAPKLNFSSSVEKRASSRVRNGRTTSVMT